METAWKTHSCVLLLKDQELLRSEVRHPVEELVKRPASTASFAHCSEHGTGLAPSLLLRPISGLWCIVSTSVSENSRPVP